MIVPGLDENLASDTQLMLDAAFQVLSDISMDLFLKGISTFKKGFLVLKSLVSSGNLPAPEV